MTNPLPIPPRISSKRAFEDLERDQPMLETRRSNLSSQISNERKKLRPSMSFDSTFWVKAIACAQQELERVDVVGQIRQYEFLRGPGANEEGWLQSSTRDSLVAQRIALEEKIKIFSSQRDRLVEDQGDVQQSAVRRSYVSFFLSSKLGANADTSAGRRETSDQSAFRERVIARYDLRGTGDLSDHVWDVILGQWVADDDTQVSHLFGYRHGEDAMVAIFGPEAREDLWSADNGVLVSPRIERHLEKGLFCIYPDFADDASLEERQKWHASEPKEWRLRFLDKPTATWVPGHRNPADHLYNRYYDHTKGVYWRDLDGRKLQFRNDARPKARYLYFQFLLNMLRFAWRFKERSTEILQSELGMPYWGTPGQYVKEGQLRGFMEQIGHVVPTTPSDVAAVDKDLAEAVTSQILTETERSNLDPSEYEDSDSETDDEYAD